MDKKEIAQHYILKMVGIPYKWGGDDPILGFDCSGLVMEFLSAFYPVKLNDMNSTALYEYFKSQKVESISFGCLIFYGNPISHVAIALDDELIIEAGGGDSKVNYPTDAAKRNAYVRIRRYNRRNDMVGIVKPSYIWG